MRIWVQKSASMQKRTSPLKFGDLAEKSGFNSVSNLSTKAFAARLARRLLPTSCRRELSLPDWVSALEGVSHAPLDPVARYVVEYGTVFYFASEKSMSVYFEYFHVF